MVVDEHEIAGPETAVHASGRVAHDHGFHADLSRRTHRQRDDLRGMPFIHVHPTLHEQHGCAVDRPSYQSAAVSFNGRCFEAGHFLERQRDCVLDLIGQSTEAGSENDEYARREWNVGTQEFGSVELILRTADQCCGWSDRPTSPASAMIVSTYGIISTNCGRISVPCNWICSVSAAAKSRHASAARTGSHRPKITAASAMNPRPAVILVGELVLVEREVRAAEPGEHAGQCTAI